MNTLRKRTEKDFTYILQKNDNRFDESTISYIRTQMKGKMYGYF